MNLPIQTITADFCVAPQLEPAAMVTAAAAGFRSIINNRPDFEGGASQPTSTEIEAAALAAGLSYRHLPVAGGFQSPDEIAQFKQLLDSLPKPILAFCRSGARSGKLFAAANQR
ncbi:TIGR01244 family sulfur transferase [Roseateles sp.]|uniref:TIGR01244 family sulfur transferase n=1 Tax=Roseateles sp. TaxID=1971397 RepID=UPI00286A5D5D|nr:TIGR01244 family sulfur transferase [Roseateles sp.]